MNLPANVLLSDDFADFSGKITALHEKKKEMSANFKKLYEDHKAAVAAIDAEAEGLQNDFFGKEVAKVKEETKTKAKEETK